MALLAMVGPPIAVAWATRYRRAGQAPNDPAAGTGRSAGAVRYVGYVLVGLGVAVALYRLRAGGDHQADTIGEGC